MNLPYNLSPWAWAILAIILGLLELHVPGSYLIWVALAAAATSLFSFATDLSLSTQLTVFAMSCAIGCALGYFVYRRLEPSEKLPALNRRELNLVGAFGTAAEPFVNGHGKVRIADTVWLAESNDDLSPGIPVVVNAVRGTTLIVTRRALPENS